MINKKKKKIFAFIFARGGSKRIKNKNLRKINGKSLVERKINFSKNINIFDEIFLSSDSQKILNLGKKNNINIIKRPKKISKDNSPETLAWKHAIKEANKFSESYTMVVLPCTSPLTIRSDIKKCLREFDKNKADLVTTIAESERSPYYNMVYKTKNKRIKIFSSKFNATNRKKIPKIYNLANSVYVTSPKYVLKNQFLYRGKIISVLIPQERFLDIDSAIDLKIANFLIRKL